MKRIFSAVLVIAVISVLCKPVKADNITSSSVIIDAGHGGVDGGAVGYSGTYEKTINLDISLELRDLLILLGYDIIMVRETDISIHSDDAITVRQMKSTDLRNRLKLSQDNPDAAYISVHQNKFSDSSQSGMCFYYSTNNPKSKAIAEKLHAKLLDSLQPGNRRQIKPAQSNLFIMYNISSPAVLIECGFISNPAEEALLNTHGYQQKIVALIAASLLEET